MGRAQFAHIHRIHADGGEFLPDRVLRLWIHGGEPDSESDSRLGVDRGGNQLVRGVYVR